jgi:hypothetical protein
LGLKAEWRTKGGVEAILIVDAENNVVRHVLTVDPTVLSNLLTEMGDLKNWRGMKSVDKGDRDPAAWALILSRANTGEVITLDPERYWDGIYNWFRSRGLDYDSVDGRGDARFANVIGTEHRRT